MNLELTLTPPQQEATDTLLSRLAVSPVCVLSGAPGSGRTAVLHAVKAVRGGVFLGTQQFRGARLVQGPAAIEEAFFRMIEEAVERHALVLIDDLDRIMDAASEGGPGRLHLLDAGFTAILAEARTLGRTLVFVAGGEIPLPLRRRAEVVTLAAA